MLGRYATLYSNQVILPLPLTAPSNVDSPKDAIREISQTSLPLLRLRPLIDAGIVYPVVRRSFHCEHTLKWCEDMKRIVYEATNHMLDATVDDFVVKFQIPEKAPTGIPSIYIEGPEDFLEHGQRILLFAELPKWRLKKWKFDKEGKVEVHGFRKDAVLSGIFAGIGEDTSFYLAYGRNRNARLLTNLRGEAMLLRDLTATLNYQQATPLLTTA